MQLNIRVCFSLMFTLCETRKINTSVQSYIKYAFIVAAQVFAVLLNLSVKFTYFCFDSSPSHGDIVYSISLKHYLEIHLETIGKAASLKFKIQNSVKASYTDKMKHKVTTFS